MKETEYSTDLHLRARDEERTYIKQRAAECGVNYSEYLRRLIQQDMGKKVTLISKEEFLLHREEHLLRKRYVEEIHKIGVNINQIVKNYNSNFYIPSEKKELVRLLNEIKELLKKGNQGGI